MGAAFAQMGRTDEAIRCFSEALRIDPQSVEAHFNLGIILARQNRIGEAVDHFSEALRLRPDLEGAQRWLDALNQRK
jgi:protein O-mannosyl-transferase